MTASLFSVLFTGLWALFWIVASKYPDLAALYSLFGFLAGVEITKWRMNRKHQERMEP